MLITKELGLQERIDLLIQLGRYLREDTEARRAATQLAGLHNKWFTKVSIQQALGQIATNLLDPKALCAASQLYPQLLIANRKPRAVGLVLAGNIPAVGFHDILTVFLAGHQALIKLSSKDKYLIRFLLSSLYELDERVKEYLQIVPMLKRMDAVIATGSDNSARYFQQYFAKYKHIIRRNRNAVAVLDGTETNEELHLLGRDVFSYFGLGCRSVSKVYLPSGYAIEPLMERLDLFSSIMNHNKYRNNYEYNRSVYLLSAIPHFANDCVLLLEQEALVSRIATLHYEFYKDEADVLSKLKARERNIQCISTQMNLSNVSTVSLGTTQQPSLWDYADKVDTLAFLLSI